MKPKTNIPNNMKIVFIFLLLFAVALASGCSGNSFEKTSSKLAASSGGFGGGYADYDMAESAPSARNEMMIAPSPVPPYESEGKLAEDRKIIKTAQLSVEVDNYQTASVAMINLAKKYDGFVSDSNSYTDSFDKKRGHVNIRVPSKNFDAILIEAGTLGKVKSQSIGGDDVTEEYTDLSARLENSKVQEVRLREILDMAENVEEVLQVERELSRVRGDIERAQGRLQYMDNRVSFSTIRVELFEPAPVLEDNDLYQALKDSVNLFMGTIRFLIRAVGFLLPLIILGAIATVIILWRLGKKKGNTKRIKRK